MNNFPARGQGRKGNTMEEQKAKDILFEIFSAGYEAGYAGKADLATAFEQYYKKLKEEYQNIRK